MVLFFVGNPGYESDQMMQALNVSLARFGAKQIQLLFVVKGTPSHVSLRLDLSVSIICDNGLASLFNAQPNFQNPNAAVIMGNNGQALCTVRKFPFMHPDYPIFAGIDRLTAEFPRLFCVAE